MSVFLFQLYLIVLLPTMLSDYVFPSLKSSLASQAFNIRAKFLTAVSQALSDHCLLTYLALFQNPPLLPYNLLFLLLLLFCLCFLHRTCSVTQALLKTDSCHHLAYTPLLTAPNRLLVLGHSSGFRSSAKPSPTHTMILTIS